MKKLFFLFAFCFSSMIGKAIPADVFTALDTVILDVYAQVQNNRDSSKMVINTLRLFDVIQNTPDSLRDEELLRDAIILLCFEFVDGVYVPNTIILYMAGKDQPEVAVFDLSERLQIANTPLFYINDMGNNSFCLDVENMEHKTKCLTFPTPEENGVSVRVSRMISSSHLTGWDVCRFYGASVLAIADGWIVKQNYGDTCGYQIWIYYPQLSLLSKYLHLSSFVKGLKLGDFVQGGQVVAYEGNSGHVFSTDANGNKVFPDKKNKTIGVHVHLTLKYVFNPIPYDKDFKLSKLKMITISPGNIFDFENETVKGPIYLKINKNSVIFTDADGNSVLSSKKKKKKIVAPIKEQKVIQKEEVFMVPLRGTVSP